MSDRSTNTAKALYSFFSGFGLPAYAIGAVSNEAEPPYITYQLLVPERLKSMPFYAEVWYRSRNLVALNAKVDEIETAIGKGISVETDAGAVWIYPGSPFHQNREFPGDPVTQCAYLNLIINALTE